MMDNNSVDMKQNVTEVGIQVASRSPSYIVDAVSSIRHLELCPEALELLEASNYDNPDSNANLDGVNLVDSVLLDRSVKDNFSCPICQGLLVRTRVLGCGHHFCRECLHRWLKLRRMCPMCRRPAMTCVPSLSIDAFVDDLVNHCGNEEVRRHHQLRKTEQASASLDDGGFNRIPVEMATMMISNYSQTVSSFSHGTSCIHTLPTSA